ncbi:MAG: magnesium/cobalt transporter CorA [Pyrinomonadaceae bacterium]|nr:magnesium/cobalt transporter CorA [Pyrinomonadaceae bacterium]
MEIFIYDKTTKLLSEEFVSADLPDLILDDNKVFWLDFEITNPEQEAVAEDILLNSMKFHHLTVEDCREARNQPKVEAFSRYLFFIIHGIKTETNTANFVTKELDGYLGENYVVTVRNEKFRSIDFVKQQVRADSEVMSRGAAYLLHQVFDRIVDMYMPLVDDFDLAINDLEDRVFLMRSARTELLEEIMDLRRSVARLKRISARQLEVLYRISHGEFRQIPNHDLPFFRDVHDHLLRISDLAESYRDLVGGLFEIHFAVTANKTNEVMKLLAVFSAILLPLSLIAGIYGMNFKDMPELQSPYGYYIALGLMFAIAAILLIYFWRRGWIFEQRNDKGK